MHSKITRVFIFFLLLEVCGGVAPSGKTLWAESPSLSEGAATVPAQEKPPTSASTSLDLQEPVGAVTLRQAVSLALMKNPELAAFSWETRAREARALQAGFRPNPEISAVVEDIGGSGVFSGVGRALTHIQLSQLIELGGKRAARTRAASLTRELAEWDYETKRLEVLTRVSQAFIDVLSAQNHLALTEETVRLAEQVAKTVSERVNAGKVSPIEETRANVALSSIRIELNRANRALEAARKFLAAAWGSTAPRFEKAVGELDAVPSSIPLLEQLAGRLAQNPDLARWAAEMSQRQALLDMEKSRAVPDLTVSGAFREFQGDRTFVAGVAIPLPFFNRNQGGVLEARHRLAKGEEERRAAQVRVTAVLVEAYRAISSAHSEVLALKANVLPGAQSAFDAINEGYRLGKFGLLDTLDAQRTLFVGRAQYLRALTDYHKAVADVERLIGQPLDDAKNMPDPKE